MSCHNTRLLTHLHTHTELLLRRTRSDSWTTTLIVTLNPNTQKIDKRNGVRHTHARARTLPVHGLVGFGLLYMLNRASQPLGQGATLGLS